MKIVMRKHRNGANGKMMYRPHFNGMPIGNTRLFNPSDFDDNSREYFESEGYLQGMADMLRITGSLAVGTRIEFDWGNK